MNSLTLLFGALSTALILAICDHRRGTMPNSVTLSSCALALLVHFYLEQGWGLLFALSGSFLCGFGPALLFLITKGGGIGGGDVKALFALGAWLGPQLGLEVELLGFLFVFLATLVQAGFSGKATALLVRSVRVLIRPRAQAKAAHLTSERTYVRFGPYLAVATCLSCINSALPLWFAPGTLS